MLRQRLPVSIALILAFIGILVIDRWTAPYYFVWTILVLTAGTLAVLESMPLLAAILARPVAAPLLLCSLLCLASNSLASVSALQGIATLGPLGCAWVVSVCVILVSGVVLFDDINPVVPRVAATLMGVAYIGVLGSFLALLRFRGGPDTGAFSLGLIIAAAKGTDIGAYTFGKLFGRHLMTPRLSPKKTWEGALGGLLFAVLFAYFVTLAESAATGNATLANWPKLLIFALAVSIAGQLGDLAESMLKREAHVKDASSSIPGFGGVLDLLDSLLLAAPAGWGILTILG